MGGRLQNEDFKTEAELISAGGAKAQLLNDTKIYVTGNSINKTLDDAIVDGDIGGGGGGGLDAFLSEDFELTQASDFSTGNNATFLGGGTLDGTLADEESSQIAGARSIKYTMGSSSTNDYWASPAITLDSKQKGNDVGKTIYGTYNGDDGDIEIVV